MPTPEVYKTFTATGSIRTIKSYQDPNLIATRAWGIKFHSITVLNIPENAHAIVSLRSANILDLEETSSRPQVISSPISIFAIPSTNRSFVTHSFPDLIFPVRPIGSFLEFYLEVLDGDLSEFENSAIIIHASLFKRDEGKGSGKIKN